ncbi:YrzQ family protein [Bacillus tuaregi]|nr:YrzQ family protein [Bacillus tuaregi]
MNKVITSMLAVSAGVAAYNYVQKNNLMSNRQMRKMKKNIKALF